ncbi:MAG TPA: (4Fe-4S)-binding protein [Puia sp.]|nr:(4Fe-4S)-binding protein [Puia sp.]
MAQETFTYTNGEVTIIWKPNICQHSGICVHGLPSVFNSKKRPWIDIHGSDSPTIIEQIKKCPSGALSFFTNESKTDSQ